MSATPSDQSELDLDGLDDKDAPLVAALGDLRFGKDWKKAPAFTDKIDFSG